VAERPWFGPKRYGWGLTPISWQGWVLTASYVVAVFLLAIMLATPQPWIFWTLFVLATVVFLLVAFLKRQV
jgi:hypothetical protein